jgi:hypothetical protein
VQDGLARIIGVYDADGTVVGELSYFLRARLGRAHCALCDVTHGRVRERADWRAAREQLEVPFVTYHRDDQPPAVRAAAGGNLPSVLAETVDGRIIPLLDPAAVERCDGAPTRLVDAIGVACAAQGLGHRPAGPAADETGR